MKDLRKKEEELNKGRKKSERRRKRIENVSSVNEQEYGMKDKVMNESKFMKKKKKTENIWEKNCQKRKITKKKEKRCWKKKTIITSIKIHKERSKKKYKNKKKMKEIMSIYPLRRLELQAAFFF